MPFNHKQSDCPYRARKANAQANAARRRAREIAFLAFLAQYDDSEDSLYTDDFSDHWYSSFLLLLGTPLIFLPLHHLTIASSWRRGVVYATL